MTAKKEKANDNMELWNQVCETDPATTKQVNQRRGFTAICAQAQIKRATELWGAYGGNWRVQDLQWGCIGEPDKPAEITLDAVFVYPDGSFQISSDAVYKPGNDTRKKLLTDITTKSLSKLGFNSDVFEGKFDDDKYIQEQKAKHAHKPKDAAGGYIDEKQRKQLFDKMQEREMMPEQLKAIILKHCGIDNSVEIPKDKFSVIFTEASKFEQEKLPIDSTEQGQ